MNIYEKLQKCRLELQKLKLKKSGKNKYAGFSYYELSDFMPAVNELFERHKLFSNFSITDEGMAILTIIDSEYINSIGEEIANIKRELYAIEFTSPIEELELKGCNKIQALGGIHTYLKRYLYFNALEIVENDIFNPLYETTEKDNSMKREKYQESFLKVGKNESNRE